MDEVDVLPVDRGRELWQLVQPRLPRTPVVAVAPVAGELLHMVERDSVVPADARQLVGPANAVEPLVEVIQCGLRDLDPERIDVVVGHPADVRSQCGQVRTAWFETLREPCSKPPRGCSGCSRCSSRGDPGPAPSSPTGWASGRERS